MCPSLYTTDTAQNIQTEKEKLAPHLCILSMVGLGLLACATGVVVVRDSRHLVAGALPGLDLVHVHPVKLLEGTVLALDNKEINHKCCDKKASREDISIREVNSTSDKRREESDKEVPEPVGSGSKSHTLCTVLAGEQFGDQTPDYRAPGSGVEEDEEASDDYHALSGAGGVLGGFNVEHEVAEGGEDHEEDKHAEGTGDEGLATTEVLDDVETTEGGSEVDGAEDDLGDEGVGDTGTLEDSGTLIC